MERLHRQFLELIQADLNETKIGDLNSVQALILHAIGREEVLVGDLTQRGYYLGTNVSYNVRKLVEGGYLRQERSAHDRRALKLRLTDKGLRLCERLDRVFDAHIRELEGVAMFDDLAHASDVLRHLSGFWSRFSAT
jgi:DNA-binding MarR family transcriptional regulator